MRLRLRYAWFVRCSLAMALAACLACGGEGARSPAGPDASRPSASDASRRPYAAIRLLIVTDLHGVLEPCGCTRASAGGADRIAALLAELRRRDPTLLFVLAGDSFFPAADRSRASVSLADAQAELKANAWVELLRNMKLDAIAPGPRDLTRGAGALAGLAHQNRVTVLSSAAPIEGLPLSAEVVRQHGARRIALRVEQASGASADLTILFRQGEQRVSEPAMGADVVIHSGLTPPRSFAIVVDGVVHASAGQDGEELLLLTLWPGAAAGARWQLALDSASAGQPNVVRAERHRLGQQAPRDPHVRRLLEQLFARINAQNRTLPAMSPAPKATPPRRTEPPGFMGARTCAACHTDAYFAWRETPHARAYQTLVSRGRELDLDCIGCHVTGFEQPGGAALGHLDELRGVGCESCHGPGEAHVDNPSIRQRTVHRVVPEAECRACHDPSHSDAFDYALKRQRLLVPGHGVARERAP